MRSTFAFFCSLLSLPLGALAQGGGAPPGPIPPLSTFRCAGLDRTYRLYRPPGLDRAQRAPLVFVLHGAGGASAQLVRVSGFDDLAAREHFLVAYPDGFEKHWNDGRGIPEWSAQRDNVDDVGFFSALIDKLVRDENADPNRVYVAGISNGGLMTHRLGCELAGKVAAVAPVVRTFTVAMADACRPARQMPILMFFGTADKVVPFGGGTQRMGSVDTPVLSADATIRKWAQIDGCDSAATTHRQDLEHIRYAACGGGSEVEAYIREGAGHAWPPGGAETIWAFFKQRRLGR